MDPTIDRLLANATERLPDAGAGAVVVVARPPRVENILSVPPSELAATVTQITERPVVVVMVVEGATLGWVVETTSVVSLVRVDQRWRELSTVDVPAWLKGDQ